MWRMRSGRGTSSHRWAEVTVVIARPLSTSTALVTGSTTVTCHADSPLIPSCQPVAKRPLWHTAGHIGIFRGTRPLRTAQGTATQEYDEATEEAELLAYPAEVRFYQRFRRSEEDVHLELLREAHLKHGVSMFVPPQLPPPGSPPEVPIVQMPAKTLERLASIKLVYNATHAPPPLSTTGHRGLTVTTDVAVDPSGSGDSPQPPTTAGSQATLVGPGAPVSSAAQSVAPGRKSRHPVEADMRYHCSECGKPFRIRESAEQHISQRHTGADGKLRAQVLDGPGPGEAEEEAEEEAVSAAPARAASKAVTPGPEKAKAPGSRLIEAMNSEQQKLKRYFSPVVEIPEDELIDTLLRGTWDSVGSAREGAAFTTYASVVEGVADRRKELEAAAAAEGKPLSRATPEGAAPGVKRSAGKTVGRGAGPLPGGKYPPIRESNKNYPNPFGDTAAAAAALEMELEREPPNPFTAEDEERLRASAASVAEGTATPPSSAPPTDSEMKRMLDRYAMAGMPSLARAATERRFVCPRCAKDDGAGTVGPRTFRLLDALLDHIQADHSGEPELNQEELQHLYRLSGSCSAFYVPKKQVAEMAPDSKSEAIAGASERPSASTATAAGAATLEGDGVAATLPKPVELSHLRVHISSFSSTVLIGTVVDIQRGFLESTPVTQYVLSVSGERPTTAATGAEVGAETEEEVEEELITVRCIGSTFPATLFKDQIKKGSLVYVQGSLKLNRHTDSESKRMHAYPYVHVTLPLGTVQLLQ